MKTTKIKRPTKSEWETTLAVRATREAMNAIAGKWSRSKGRFPGRATNHDLVETGLTTYFKIELTIKAGAATTVEGEPTTIRMLSTVELRQKWSRVGTWREHGCRAKWGKYRGQPVICVQRSNDDRWWTLDSSTFDAICANLEAWETLQDAIDGALAVADLFHI